MSDQTNNPEGSNPKPYAKATAQTRLVDGLARQVVNLPVNKPSDIPKFV